MRCISFGIFYRLLFCAGFMHVPAVKCILTEAILQCNCADIPPSFNRIQRCFRCDVRSSENGRNIDDLKCIWRSDEWTNDIHHSIRYFVFTHRSHWKWMVCATGERVIATPCVWSRFVFSFSVAWTKFRVEINFLFSAHNKIYDCSLTQSM